MSDNSNTRILNKFNTFLVLKRLFLKISKINLIIRNQSAFCLKKLQLSLQSKNIICKKNKKKLKF